MLTVVHVAASDLDLASAWLCETSRRGEKPILTAAAADSLVLHSLALRHELECFLIPDDPLHPEALALRPLMERVLKQGATAILLCDPIPFNMVFRSNQIVPSWHDHFPAIRCLHMFGIKQFRFVGRGGQYEVRIPWLLDDLLGRHKGQRGFVIGNGPSLRETPMKALKDEVTFGSNRSFLGYDDWGFSFKYWAISDRLQIEAYREEYEENVDADAIKFFPFEYITFLRMKNACPFNISSDLIFGGDKPIRFPYFSAHPSGVFMAFTVTITLIQIAVMLGCNPIILLGVDHSYPIARVKRQGSGRTANLTAEIPSEELSRRSKLDWDFWEGNAATGATHFSDKYTSNKIFVPPRTAWSEAAYDYCRLWGDRYGVEILNATPGSHLTSFRKVDFAGLDLGV